MPAKINQHYYTGVPTGFRTVAKSENLALDVLYPYCVYNLPDDCPANAPEKPDSFHYVNSGNGELIIGQSQYKPGGRAGNYFTHQYIIDQSFENKFIGDIDISNIFGLPFNVDYNDSSDRLNALTAIPRLPNFNINKIYEFRRSKLIVGGKIEIDFPMFSMLLKAMFEAAYGTNIYIYCPYRHSKNLMAILFYALPYHIRKKIGFITYKKEVDALKNINVVFTGKNEMAREINVNSGKQLIDLETGSKKNMSPVKENDIIYNYIKFAWEALENKKENMGRAFREFYSIVKKELKSLSRDEYMGNLDRLAISTKNELRSSYESTADGTQADYLEEAYTEPDEQDEDKYIKESEVSAKKIDTINSRTNDTAPLPSSATKSSYHEEVNYNSADDDTKADNDVKTDNTAKTDKADKDNKKQLKAPESVIVTPVIPQEKPAEVNEVPISSTLTKNIETGSPKRKRRTNNSSKKTMIVVSSVLVLALAAGFLIFRPSSSVKSPTATQTAQSSNTTSQKDVITLKDALNKQGLTLDQAKQEAKLDLSNQEISDLKGLEEFNNLKELWLNGNNISDIAPLANLSNLTKLVLSGNSIADITPLKGLSNLQELNLYDNSIVDLSPLAGLTKLTKLNAAENNIEDISPLGDLTNLKGLELYNNNIADISSLQKLVNLTSLSLDGNKISIIDALKATINLTSLYLAKNTIDDYNAIAAYYKNLKDKDIFAEVATVADNSSTKTPVLKNVETKAVARVTVDKKKPQTQVNTAPTEQIKVAAATEKPALPTEKPAPPPKKAATAAPQISPEVAAKIKDIAYAAQKEYSAAEVSYNDSGKQTVKEAMTAAYNSWQRAKNAKTVDEANVALKDAQKYAAAAEKAAKK